MELHMRNFNAQGLIARLRLAFLLMLALVVAGCGGGGGGSSSSDCPTQFSASCGTTGGGTTGGTTTTTGTVLVTLLDSTAATRVETHALTAGKPVTVEALVKDASGVVVPNAVVTFTTDAAYGTFEPSSGTALTNSSGVATVTLVASSLNSNGAGIVKATASVGGTVVSDDDAYAVTPGVITLSDLTVMSSSIGAYGSTSVYADVLVNGAKPASPQTVSFSSGCATSGKAEISTSVASVNGRVTATYKDKGCAGPDTISATISGVTKSGVISVAAPKASNISYDSATPATIYITGTSGAGKLTDSVVKFKVVDSSGNPVAGKLVNFSLSTTIGGIKLNDTTATSDASGVASVTVSAGTVPTPLWVKATLADDATIVSQSPNLSIVTGLPTQDRFSVALETLNIEGWRRDGTTTTATIHAFDRLGNPVPDGTAINFVSEGAGVTSPCTTVSGACSVTVTSGEFRPRVDSEPSLYGVSKGRITILAYANGEESFDDRDGDNAWSSGEDFRDLGSPFVDNNENGVWDANEQYFTFDPAANAVCSLPADGRYYNARSKATTCSGTWGNNYVRRSIVLVLSSHEIGAVQPSVFSMNSSCSRTFTFRLADENNNPMPAGASLALTANLPYTNATGSAKASATLAPGASVVPNTSAAGGSYHTFTVEGTDCVTYPKGNVTLSVTSAYGSSAVNITIQ